MIDVASVVCGIIFPILIVAIICVALQLRKSQGYLRLRITDVLTRLKLNICRLQK